MNQRKHHASLSGSLFCLALTGSAWAGYLDGDANDASDPQFNASDYAAQLVSSSGSIGQNTSDKLYFSPSAVLGAPNLYYHNGVPPGNEYVSIVNPPTNTSPDGNPLITQLNNLTLTTPKTANPGTIEVKMGSPVYANPTHPYGIDFIVYGNSFFEGSGGGSITNSTNLNNVGITSLYGHDTSVSVSPDGVDWYTYPDTPSLLPYNAYLWDSGNATWSSMPADQLKPVNPGVDSLLPGVTANSTTYSTAGIAANLYCGASGGTGYSLQGTGFSSIQYLKVTPGNQATLPNPTYTVINAFAAARSMAVGDELSIAPNNITAGTNTLYFQDPNNAAQTLVTVNFAAVSDAAGLSTGFVTDPTRLTLLPGYTLQAYQLGMTDLLGNNDLTYAANLSLFAGYGYTGNGSDLSVYNWNGTAWQAQAFTFNAATDTVNVNGLTNLSALAITGALSFNGRGNYTIGTALNTSNNLTVAGTGTTTLSGNNTGYTGTATVSNGTLNLANVSALVNAGLNVTGGNVTFDQNAGGTSFTIANLSGGGGNIILQTNAANNPAAITLTVGGDNSSTTYGGLVSGIGSLSKVGNGMLTLTNANTYSGATIINAGTLNVTAASNGLLTGSNVANYATLQFAGTQTLGSISGNGTTIVTGNLTVTSFAQASLINNGTTTINGNSAIGQLAGTGNLTIGNGTLANTVTLAAAATPGVLGGIKPTQGMVTIAGDSTLDITNNALLLNYGNGASPLVAVANAVVWGAGNVGNASTASNGTIISGTVVAANANAGTSGKYAVGYADHTEISSIPTGNVEVAYTLAGDANLDGSVDILDYQAMAPHYDEAGVHDWSQGDFNHDGHVDILDYQAMAPNYDSKLTAGTLAGTSLPQSIGGVLVSATAEPIGSAVAAEAMTAMEATDITAVPEPASLGLLLLGGLPILSRRRRPN